jgi:integrase
MKPKKSFPGSIIIDKRYNTLYIKFKGKKTATGLKDTKINRKIAEAMLEKMFYDYTRLGELPGKKKLISEAFKDFLLTKINKYDKTLKCYQWAYNAVISGDYYLNNDRIESDIQKYISKTSHSAVTINNYLRHLQVFFNFCIQKKWIEYNNYKADYSKKETHTPQSYTDDEIRQIINYFDNNDPEISLLIQFMLETGARMVDCLTLTKDRIKAKSIIWQNKITKRNEERPVTQRTIEILKTVPKRKDDRLFRC